MELSQTHANMHRPVGLRTKFITEVYDSDRFSKLTFPKVGL